MVERLAVDAPVVRPEFRAGDAVLFDDMYLHRTAIDPTMTASALRDRVMVLRADVVPRRPGAAGLVNVGRGVATASGGKARGLSMSTLHWSDERTFELDQVRFHMMMGEGSGSSNDHFVLVKHAT